MESAKPFIMLNPNTYGGLTSNHKVVLAVEAEIIVSQIDGLSWYMAQLWLSLIELPVAEFFLAVMHLLLDVSFLL